MDIVIWLVVVMLIGALVYAVMGVLAKDCTLKWEIVARIDKWLRRRFGLALTTEQHLRDLEHQACELAVLSAHLYEQESEVH